MKKIGLFIALFCAAMMLVSCGKKDDKVLVMASSLDFPPYESIDESGNPVGIDVDMAQAICAKLGYTLKIENMDFDSILPAVQSGKADLGISGFTINPEREKNVDFSIPYIDAAQMILVRTGSDVKSIEDLKGKKVCGQSGTTGVDYAKELLGEENVDAYQSYSEVIQAVLSGKAEAAVLDDGPARAHAKANEGKLFALDKPLTVEHYGIAFKKGNPLRDEFNTVLKELIDSGEMQKFCVKHAPETFGGK
jgi:arginine/lysine/histidine transporter system substrate-binding protein